MKTYKIKFWNGVFFETEKITAQNKTDLRKQFKLQIGCSIPKKSEITEIFLETKNNENKISLRERIIQMQKENI